MVAVPKQLFTKATNSGLVCITSETGTHCIQPEAKSPDWALVCQKGDWVLTIKGVPQMRFHYEDAMKFLDRFAKPSNPSAL